MVFGTDQVPYKYRMSNGADADDVFKSSDGFQISITIPAKAIRDGGRWHNHNLRFMSLSWVSSEAYSEAGFLLLIAVLN